jgi:hypothetical protein
MNNKIKAAKATSNQTETPSKTRFKGCFSDSDAKMKFLRGGGVKASLSALYEAYFANFSPLDNGISLTISNNIMETDEDHSAFAWNLSVHTDNHTAFAETKFPKDVMCCVPVNNQNIFTEGLFTHTEAFAGDTETLSGDTEIFSGDAETLPGDTEIFAGDTEIFSGGAVIVPGDAETLPGDAEILSGDTENFAGDTEILPGDAEIFAGSTENLQGIHFTGLSKKVINIVVTKFYSFYVHRFI